MARCYCISAAIETGRLLNHFTSEYCVKLKHGWKAAKDTLSISDYFVGQVEYGRKSPLDG